MTRSSRQVYDPTFPGSGGAVKIVDKVWSHSDPKTKPAIAHLPSPELPQLLRCLVSIQFDCLTVHVRSDPPASESTTLGKTVRALADKAVPSSTVGHGWIEPD